MNRKNHVAGCVHFGGIWVAGTVVEEVDDSFGGFLGALDLAVARWLRACIMVLSKARVM